MEKYSLFYGVTMPIQEFILRQVEKEYKNRSKESIRKYIYNQYNGFIRHQLQIYLDDDYTNIYQIFKDIGIDDLYGESFSLIIDDKEENMIYGYEYSYNMRNIYNLKTEEDIINTYFQEGELEEIIEDLCLYNIPFELYKINENEPFISIVEMYKNRRKL